MAAGRKTNEQQTAAAAASALNIDTPLYSVRLLADGVVEIVTPYRRYLWDRRAATTSQLPQVASSAAATPSRRRPSAREGGPPATGAALTNLDKQTLLALARRLGIRGRSRMTATELAAAIAQHERRQSQ